MEFLHTPLGPLNAGSVVEVTLSGTEANVQLLDTGNLERYRSGREYRCVGGHYRKSPVHLNVPNAGQWHVTVDLGGYDGSVDAAVRVVA